VFKEDRTRGVKNDRHELMLERQNPKRKGKILREKKKVGRSPQSDSSDEKGHRRGRYPKNGKRSKQKQKNSFTEGGWKQRCSDPLQKVFQIQGGRGVRET